MTKKRDESEQSEEQPEEKKVKKFFSTSDRPQPKRKVAMLTTRDLPTFLPNYHGKKIN